jgi:hypothetical protein
MSTPQDQAAGAAPQDEAAGAAADTGMPEAMGGRQAQQPTEEELRAAYEAELSRITTGDMILQSAASLLNIGGLRLGLVPDAKVERDLEQVRDAVDAVSALLPIIERHDPQQLRPLRDALSQLQMAYAREVQAVSEPTVAETPPAPPAPKQPEDSSGPGPAQSSGRLWVPGR